MRKLPFVLVIFTTLFFGGQTPSPLQQQNVQRDLAALTQRGFTYRMLDNDLIELTDPVSGEKHLKSLSEPSEATIRAWAAQRGIPILEIDPTTVDTSKYKGWYKYFTTVPLSNAFQNPLIVADLDRNGKTECYGLYNTPNTNHETRCYEIDSLGNPLLRYNYAPLRAVARLIIDVERDSLREVFFTRGGGFVSDYEQPLLDSIPTVLNFEHNQYEGDDPGYSGIYAGNLDGDSLTDFLYKGSDQDSTKIFVTEYNPQVNNFVRVWSTNYGLPGVAGIGGFAVDDFDGDGRMEFVVSESSYGRIFVTENVGDNGYVVTWQDSTPFINLYHTIGGDVDGDGKPEFFVGGDTPNGNWTIMYEADSNNHYSPQFMFHIVPDGFFAPTYLVTDVDGDGHPDLVILSSGFLHVFKGAGDNQYRLLYFRHDDNTLSCQCFDVNGDGRKDILISKGVNEIGLFTDVYIASKLVHVSEPKELASTMSLLRCYPNPFNPSTTIEYSSQQGDRVKLSIHDLLGREVAVLAEEKRSPGFHTVDWNAANESSGIYFCRLQTDTYFKSIKLLLLK